MRIPEETIEDVRHSVNIVDVIGSSVRLKKAGGNYVGLCPFHQEKTPSFTVNAEKQIYKCFGCGEGGNVFTFIMKDQSISFADAVRQLAEKAGIRLPQYKEDPKEKKQQDALYAVIDFAAEWYEKNLWDTPGGKKALDYLGKRGFSDGTLRAFRLGYAPDAWEGLLTAASRASFSNQVLRDAGLILQKQGHRTHYDRFRNRIIFPVMNEFGRTVGFGARKFDEREPPDSPKYINSPESLVYHKGRLLYGLFQNKDAVRKKDMAIFVEGYTDVLALYEHGIRLGMATQGTALTPRQAHLVNRYTGNVVLLYDADVPGVHAALRGADVLFGAGIDVQVVNLGSGADPDSFLRNNSKETFIDAVENRQSVVDFFASHFTDSGKEISYQERADRIRRMIDLVDSVRDNLKRDLMLKEIGEKLSTDAKTVFKEFYRKKRSRNRKAATGAEKIGEKQAVLTEIDPLEREIGSIMVNNSDLGHLLINLVDLTEIHNPSILKIVEVIKKRFPGKKRYTAGDLVGGVQDEQLHKVIAGLAMEPSDVPGMNREETVDRLLRVAEDICARLRLRRMNRELDALREKIRKKQSAGTGVEELTAQYQTMLYAIRDLEQSVHQEFRSENRGEQSS